jgi:hypothetical protein
MKYESVQNNPISDYNRDAILDIIMNVLENDYSDLHQSFTKRSNYQDDILEIIDETLAHRTYGMQKVRVATARIIRNMGKKLNTQEKQYMETQGYYLGGHDWKPSANAKSQRIDKQSAIFITPEGLVDLGAFGHSANSNVDLIFGNKYDITCSVYSSGVKDYYTITKLNLLDGSREEMNSMIAQEDILYHDELDYNNGMDLYQPRFVRGKISWVDAKPKLVIKEFVDQPVIVDGKKVYDEVTGKEITTEKPVYAEEGFEDLLQLSLDDDTPDRQSELFVGTIKLESFEDGNYRRYTEIQFYNQKLGRTWVDVDLFRNDTFYSTLQSAPTEEGLELLRDDFRSFQDEFLFLVKPIKIYSYEKDGNEIDNCRVVGYFVSDTFDFNVEEKKSQPMTTTTLRNR